MDRLSGLPKTILHDILARLPYKDAAKTSALSKTWRDTWSSYPNLFSKMDILIDYVTKRLLRLCAQGLTIKEFKLNLIYLLHPPHGSHDVDRWIQMASESGVELLELYLSNGSIGREYSEDIWYDLPLCVIEAKSLTKLVLTGGIIVGQEFLNHSIKFSSVKMLSLSRVLFRHEGVIEHLISRCPLIEHLTVEHCSVYNHLSIDGPQVDRICHVKSLFLNGLQKLKEVDVQGIEEEHIDSPNLEKLCYSHFKLGGPLKLNFDSCTKLRCFE
ncbi:hypothetical protein PIB30_048886 [Stylosanthes scabra]|uniref:F-box domain-containing protein n=1 Tax=Stylosanthes scabra TaxID=79078 RepID=A0ABU6RHX3_9FABA|nr:hypothetical protein [Stylosanthes scabra]